MFSIAFRGIRRGWREFSSAARLWALQRQFPGLSVHGRVRVGRGCDIFVARGSRLVIRDCAIAPWVTLTTAPGALLEIDADFIGPGCVLVAREQVRLGEGCKVAEHVTIRDANHDRSAPLSQQKFHTEPVEIGKEVWIAASSVILAGVRVGDGATIAAGAVVTRSVEPGDTVGGVPARSLHQ